MRYLAPMHLFLLESKIISKSLPEMFYWLDFIFSLYSRRSFCQQPTSPYWHWQFNNKIYNLKFGSIFGVWLLTFFLLFPLQPHIWASWEEIISCSPTFDSMEPRFLTIINILSQSPVPAFSSNFWPALESTGLPRTSLYES